MDAEVKLALEKLQRSFSGGAAGGGADLGRATEELVAARQRVEQLEAGGWGCRWDHLLP